jgi:hypothetical protein
MILEIIQKQIKNIIGEVRDRLNEDAKKEGLISTALNNKIKTQKEGQIQV